MRKLAAVIGVVTAGLVLAACTSTGSSPAPSAKAAASTLPAVTLAGSWTLKSYLADGKMQAVPAGVNATAIFLAGRIAGDGGCNSFTGEYTVDGSKLTIGPLASTMMACEGPGADVETAYFANLGKVASFAGSDTALTLSDASGASLLEYVPTPKGELTGLVWVATAINNGKGAVESTANTSMITAEFTADGKISGNATCNQYNGTYTTDGDKMTIGALATTRMACASDELNAQEQAYIAALGNVATYTISNGTLELRAADGALQAQYTSK
jgi:heat shock protein HslJ